tara:strand:+ start:14 stop:667 length:654 start_codon:yes stop_codon:yes gene_type:complete
MKQIPIKNIKLLRNLDNFAETLYKMPHTFEALPKPDLSFATLKTLMADAKFVGYPKQHNYQSYEGQIAPLQVGQHKRRLRTEKYFFLKQFQQGMGEHFQQHPLWYYDTVTVMPPRWGHTGWHNSKNKGRHYIRFIHNTGNGYSISVKDKKQVTIKDQWRGRVGAGNWTCISGHMGADGKTWFADRNTGAFPRVVIDVSIPEKYTSEVEGAINFITTY